ncbi:MoaD/ThiS family protein [Leucobacter sp. W1153]|uniref:MoaD/ThiS family protein n=1 Tax=unclassified Leucobacter TaxID=2621730 RepID=UPI003F3DE3C5
MPHFTVRYFAAAADAALCEAETWELPDGSTVGELRDRLTERYGRPMFRVLQSGSFLVDGRVQRDGTTPLTGSTIDVLPAFAGG